MGLSDLIEMVTVMFMICVMILLLVGTTVAVQWMLS